MRIPVSPGKANRAHDVITKGIGKDYLVDGIRENHIEVK